MGRRKKIVQECERLMDNPENIRNIAIAAHIDHGKCVAGESRVSLGDGSVVRAGDLFESISETGEPTEDPEGEAYTPTEDVRVTAFDRATGTTVTEPIEYACKRAADEPLVEVTTSNGHVLATTPEHRFLVLTPAGVMEFERAEDLEAGQVVVGVRQVAAGSSEGTRATLLRSLASDPGFVVDVEDEFVAAIGTHERADLVGAAETGSSRNAFDDAVRRDRYRLMDLTALCDDHDVDLEELYDAIASIDHRDADRRVRDPSRPLRPPTDLTSLFYLAGALAGGGDRLGSGVADEPDLSARLTARAEALWLESTDRADDDGTTRTAVDDELLQAVLHRAFGVPTPETAPSARVPDLVFAADRDATAAYVRGYVDAAGTVEPHRSAVSVDATSVEMLETLQLLLYQFDVASELDRREPTLRIAGGLSLSNFGAIGFGLDRKRERFATLLESARPAAVDRVPIDGGKLREIREDVGASRADVSASYRAYETGDDELDKRSLARLVDRFDRFDDRGDIRLERLRSLARADSSFVTVVSTDRTERQHVYDFGVEGSRNFVAEGLVVHNTTLTDNLLAGAGMISKDLAGQQLAMDTEEDEQERGITIDAANVSMTHEYQGTNHLVNLIDTPGHVDFGGDVTRAMRAVDGALVVVDAVEGTMPQTETVLRQALREDVKPALFVNKVDRLINELREGPQEMQERLQTVIHEVNELIRGIAPERFEEDDWGVSVQDGTVAFGSALYNWAVSLPSMQETGIDFGDIIDYNQDEEVEELKERSPLSDVVLDMVAEHFPNPLEAQPRRIPRIWRGDDQSEIAEQMRLVDDEGEVVLMVTDISLDPHAGEIATGRLFSGTIERGQDLYVSGTAGTNRIQSVGIFMGGEREEVERVPAGNIAAVTGLKDAIAGSTVSSVEMTAFESIEHISEPVITKSIEAQSMDDLPKLIEVLQQVSKEDPTLKVDINEDTGEHLISGQGELHLEVQTQRIERNQGIPVRTGEPIVVYREAPQTASQEVEGVSPNRHNRFYMRVQPLPESLVDAIKLGELSMDMPELERREVLQEHGVDKDTSQNLEHIFGTNLVFDDTKGIQHLNETMELVIEGFEEALDEGPLAAEPVQGAMVHLVDARLHEDAIHRGPAQVIPAVREALHRALIDAEVRLLEPVQDVRIDVPSEFMGPASSEIQGRRGRVDDMYQEGDRMVIEGVAPVEEMIGFSSDIRSATEGRASWNTENAGFEVLADNLHPEIIAEIRERKGMKQELPAGVDYL